MTTVRHFSRKTKDFSFQVNWLNIWGGKGGGGEASKVWGGVKELLNFPPPPEKFLAPLVVFPLLLVTIIGVFSSTLCDPHEATSGKLKIQ